MSYDLAIIGGGINGAGIARDAAGRGLKVLLCEKGDLAGATSSASSKLIHGGLRYLEYHEYGLVRESLQERERLLKIAPHLIHPREFILPYLSDMRPAWMIRAGLFLYDHLARRKSLPGSHTVELAAASPYGAPLKPRYEKGFSYADCWVDDARLVLANAMDAAERGADIRTRTECVRVVRGASRWELTLQPAQGEEEQVEARVLVNAAGPWANQVLDMAHGQTEGRVKLVKGSHIVVPRVHEGDHAYILQMQDKRIIFLLPFEERYSLIGTTDVPYDRDPSGIAISQAEIDYLLEGVNGYLHTPLKQADIVWSFAGVRALYNDASENVSAMTRDYVLELDKQGPVLLSVLGGKLTTYRRLAEEAMEKLLPHLPPAIKAPWTHTSPLPGGKGEMPEYPWLPTVVYERWKRQYGTRLAQIVDGATDVFGLGEEVVPGVFERELDYARTREWAHTAEDFLWRRSKLGLHLSDAEQEKIEQWFDKNTV